MAAQRKHTLWSVKGVEGHIRGQGSGAVQQAYMRFKDRETSLKIPFTSEYKPLGMKILRAEQERRRLRSAAKKFGIDLPEHLKSVSEQHPVVKKSNGVRVNLRQLIEEFKDANFPSFSKNVRRHLEVAINFYIRLECEWNMLDEKQVAQAGREIHASLVKAHNSGEVVTNTLEKYYNNIIRVFDYIVKVEALKTNPVASIPKPERIRGSKRGRWLPMEAEIILYWLEKTQTVPAFSESVRFLLLSGIRIGELLDITREKARGDYISVCSKVQSHQKEEEVRREIPVNTVPGLRECLDALLALPPSKRRLTMLFPQKDYNGIRAEFNLACDYACIQRNGRTINCCRKSAIWWLEDEELWDRQDITDMAGHSEEIDDIYYRETPKGKELEQRINRRKAQRAESHHAPTGNERV